MGEKRHNGISQVQGVIPMLSEIWIRGYRSVRKLTMPLGRINLVQGANGCGKSNLYNAIHLLASAASGELARAICAE